ncbi:hypothetical protein DCC81_16110 [Chitinophaga parva]|uniref:SusD-like N-terminal domain-containing protein n=1 Tax=Chitinophaga parva TaxID=2169414 RepID=A0A2T7BHM7_9BACT|nr:RagB/SusD family nutrient uptake outer membrane protein [Chitinophaga parva]PUZ25784.1 hypothetical protein DCC81_16110 [Chitinophaga parva]
MKNSYIITLFLVCGLLTMAGCKKYLDVQPLTSYTESQVYGNEKAIDQALNGLYLNLAANQLYGANLTTTTVELLAQRYKPRTQSNNPDLSVFNYYQYGSAAAQATFDTLWRQGYATILAANVFLSKIDNAVGAKVITSAHADELKGEAIALRAMMHFDLLRLFGPVFSVDSTSPAIPYYRKADGQSQPILSGGTVLANVIADLKQAQQLLQHDPVITSGIILNTDFYTGSRNQRLNYYAVEGLLARAYLWEGDKQHAHEAALTVLTQGEKWFPWTTYDVANDPVNPDRIFSSEILFSVYNPALYTNFTTYFSSDLQDAYILAPDPTRLANVYESNEGDYRYSQDWIASGKSYRTFFKYQDLTQPALPWRFLQPVLRKSEMYFILAETDTDPGTALGYLNTARRNRGLTALTATASISEELRKEYQKEFWGEGQLFFYYKRINATQVPDAAYPYDFITVDPAYVVPLPLSETSTR